MDYATIANNLFIITNNNNDKLQKSDIRSTYTQNNTSGINKFYNYLRTILTENTKIFFGIKLKENLIIEKITSNQQSNIVNQTMSKYEQECLIIKTQKIEEHKRIEAQKIKLETQKIELETQKIKLETQKIESYERIEIQKMDLQIKLQREKIDYSERAQNKQFQVLREENNKNRNLTYGYYDETRDYNIIGSIGRPAITSKSLNTVIDNSEYKQEYKNVIKNFSNLETETFEMSDGNFEFGILINKIIILMKNLINIMDFGKVELNDDILDEQYNKNTNDIADPANSYYDV